MLGQNFCVTSGGTTFQTCRFDGQCFYLDTAQSCPSALQTCQPQGNGTGVCTCNSGLCTPGSASCTSGTNLQLCQADQGGCGVASNIDCSASVGQTCVSTPSAHCTCPAAAGDTLFVDVGAGSDTFGTGAGTPASCAFKSITKGLASVGTTFTTVKARTGTYSAAASGETFPLQLPSGIALTTDAAPSAGSPYVISGSGNFDLTPVGAINAAIVYTGSGAARVENFTVKGTGGTTTDVFACNAGSPTLSGVVLQLGMRGAGLYGSCAAALTGVKTTQNTQAGVLSASSGAVTVTGQLSDGDASGLRHNAGAITVTGMEVKNATSDGIRVVPQNRGVTASLSFTASGLNVHDGAGNGLLLDRVDPITISAVAVSSSMFSANRGIGLNLLEASPSFSGVQVNGNGGEGIVVDVDSHSPGNTATFDGTTVSANCRPGNPCRGILVSSGTLNLSGTQGSPTTVNANVGDGIEASGGSFVGSTVTVSANTQRGVLVRLATGGETFSCAGCTVSTNGRHGYEVQAAVGGAGPAFSVTGGTVAGNGTGGVGMMGSHGIWLRANDDDVDAAIANVIISGNTHGSGLLMTRAGNVVTATVTGNEITGNGATIDLGGPGAADVGGIAIVGSVALSAFNGNKVHSNVKNGVSVFGGTVNLNPGSCSNASTPPNELYCYGQGNVGIVASGGANVNAGNNQWAHAPPTSGVDFQGAVDPGTACAAVATCP
jgi:hypothetical protein